MLVHDVGGGGGEGRGDEWCGYMHEPVSRLVLVK